MFPSSMEVLPLTSPFCGVESIQLGTYIWSDIIWHIL
jgi:hypothetical protein